MTINTWLNAARSPSDSGSQNQLTHRVVAEPGATGAMISVGDGFAAIAPSAAAPRAVTPQQALRRPASPVASDDGSEDDGSYAMSDGFDEASIGGYSDFEFESHDRDADAIGEQVRAAVQMLGDDARISHFGREIKFHLPWETMPEATQLSAGMMHGGQLKFTVDAHDGYSSGAQRPQLQVIFGPGDATDKVCRSDKLNAEFPLGILLIKALGKYLDQAWPPRSETHVLDMYNELVEHIEDAGNACMLCCDTLASGGANLTVCDSALCSYQLESLGLGASLSLLQSDPKTADLLISASMSALEAVGARPSAMPTLPTDANGEPIAAATALSALKSLPSMKELIDEPSRHNELLGTAQAEVPRLLRWIFATNRAHLTPLPEERRFASVNTEHQFEINSSTRKHAAAFASLKEQHGSLFAFHGSPFCNWHNILRNNLQNASGTAMMSTGAVHGAGIYLAPTLSFSLDYARPSAAWAGSTFGNSPRCVAVCEVVNAPQLIKPLQGIVVAPSEHLVTLRYLFVFDAYAAINPVHVDELALQKYRNDTTIAGQEPIASVPKDQLLVTSDGYAWDIDELTQMVAAKNGLFINGYTSKGFAPADVDLILRHPRAKGPLQNLEASNKAAKSLISRNTLNEARRVGAICKNDSSADFAVSMAAIAALRGHLETLPAQEKDALARAPFDAVDSHTQQAMRETLPNALASVTQGGECIHKFGDFLSQLK